MGAWEPLTFRFASDATFADPSTATINSGAQTLSLSGVGGMTCPLAALPAVHSAGRELLDQPVDGATITEIRVDGTDIDLHLSPDRLLVGFDQSPNFSREKAEGFLSALLDTGLVAAP